jgi:hypothetical protein
MVTTTAKCSQCASEFVLLSRSLRQRLNRSDTGRIFCSTACAHLGHRLDAQVPKNFPRHGLPNAYNRGCRCDPCRAAHRIRLLKYRQSKKRVDSELPL